MVTDLIIAGACFVVITAILAVGLWLSHKEE
jgi:FtsZ-interacting cell division protein ZipA